MTRRRPHILISNDDGIHAPGIKQLWKALRPHAELTVVAPSGEQSAVGLCTTLRSPLRLEKVFWGEAEEHLWSVTGTPADCVKMALHSILDSPPTLIVSGINRGANMGRTVLYSGTLAAAIEGIMQGIPGVAFSSSDYYAEPDYQAMANYIPNIVKYVLDHPMPSGTLLNVNFPERNLGQFKGLKMTAQGKDWWGENPDKREHPNEGHSYYWLGGKLRPSHDSDDADGAWLRQGYITAVPVHVADLTDRNHLEKSKLHFESLFVDTVCSSII